MRLFPGYIRLNWAYSYNTLSGWWEFTFNNTSWCMSDKKFREVTHAFWREAIIFRQMVNIKEDYL